jgi:hypothetical protein
MWMLRNKRFVTVVAACSAALALNVGCSDDDGVTPTGDGGAGGAAGSSSAGKSGSAAGGKSGGANAGASNGGMSAGGSSAAGTAGDDSTAGTGTGGSSTGGSATAGSGGKGGSAGSGTSGSGGSGGTAGSSAGSGGKGGSAGSGTSGSGGSGGTAGSSAGSGGKGGSAGSGTAGAAGSGGTAGSGTAGAGGSGGTAGSSTAGAGGSGGTAGSSAAGTGGNGGSGGSSFTPISITVLNPGFETGSDNQPAQNWQSTGDTGASYLHYNQSSTHSGFGYLAFYSATAYSVDTSQTINGLTNGTYVFSAWIEGGTAVSMYATAFSSPSSEKKTDITPTSSYVQYSVTGIQVTNGSIKIGFRAVSAAANAWANIDDVTLTRVQ